MRVLMVSKACVVGAYQRKLEELACLPEMELTVAVPPSWRDPSGTIRLERRYTQGYELVVEPIAFNGLYHLHFYPRLGSLMRRVRPDLVHIDEEPYNLAAAHALWLAGRAGTPSLFFSWQNINRRYPAPFRWLEAYVLGRAAAGIVGNQDAGQVWRAKGYRGPLVVIPQFGVDPDLFAPNAPTAGPAAAPRGFTVGFAGRLVEEKGVDLLLEALAGLAGAWQAIVVGTGPARALLEAQVHRQGTAGRVSFAGPVPSAQMPGLYRKMDVLVLPSRTRPNWKEQFGRSLVEAMACGVTVVGSDSGEIPHVIGDAGLLFPEGQAGELRERLSRLMADAALRQALAQRGRDRVVAHFTQAQIAARTYQVYREVLGGQSACP
jgi:glycosyltransferase involved in cell wall biosynthesis